MASQYSEAYSLDWGTSLAVLRLQRSIALWIAGLACVSIAAAQPAYPLKASANKRYLVDQNSQPVFLVGDSPHAMFVNLSTSQAATYLANRASYGINALWVEVLCGSYIPNCRSDMSTFDGIVPFTTPGDISTPNPAFFSRIDAMVATAAQNGITILMDTWETGGEMGILRANGAAKAFNYGVFLGSRYKNSPNIIWITGNDFVTWTDSTDNNLIENIMAGIASVDPNHLQTSQLDYPVSGSHDDSLLLPYTTLDAVYSYPPQYAEIYAEYNASPTIPVFMEEANYEGENNTGNDPSTSKVLRQQEYWSMLAGALGGQMYGSSVTAYFQNGWQNGLDTPGVRQLQIMKSFFGARQWWGLVPDQAHTVVTAGYGAFSNSGAVHTNNYVTAARATDGSLVIAYTPASTTLTVSMSQLNGPVTARWFDPVNGTFTAISGSPFANSGTHNFATPGNNSGGDSDWVLLLEANADTQPPTVPGTLTATAGQGQITLGWTPSSDNVGVTGYLVERCAGVGCNNFVQIGSTAQNTAPLAASANPNYFKDGSGTPLILNGSQTWNSLQDWGSNGTVQTLDFNAFVNFLTTHGHNFTLLWRTEMPKFCGLPSTASAPPDLTVTPHPWQRTGPGTATDGAPKFDLTKFDQSYFDRLRSRVQALNAAGIYAGVYLFTGEWLNVYRCSTDGYPFTGANNINGIDDGYSGGSNGIGSMTMTAPNPISAFQDAYVEKVMDTLNDLPNVLWIVSEEAPTNSTWWNDHQISHIRSYESGKPLHHPIGYATLASLNDTVISNSNAEWIAPGARISSTSTCGSGTPACKVNVNDSDHSYFGMWNDSAQQNRNYAWENFMNGNQVLFMDPYVVYYPRENRNVCVSPANAICVAPDARWDNFRNNLGYILRYSRKLNLASVTPHASLCSTGYCLAQTPSTGAEYLVYAPSGGSFTVNLSAMPSSRTLSVEWFNPSTGATTTAASIPAGSSSQSFTPPFSGDAVLYLADTAGHASAGQPASYIDTSVSAGVSYSYRVRAIDAASNLSPYSNVATAVVGTLDTQPPSAPGSLSAASAAPGQINLSWSASTDNVAVTGYAVERCPGSGCSSFSQIASVTGITYHDGGLSSSTTYTYRVRAFDAASNLSAYSNTASATTSAVISGLVAAYSFNEGSGTTVFDASGNGNNGTIAGAIWTASGKYGNALSFDGASSYVDLGNPASLQLTGSATWSAWIKAAANPADDGQIVAKSDDSAGWQFKTSPDTGPETFGVGVSPGGTSRTQRYSTTVRSLNTWYHVAGVYDASAGTLNIYVNGVLDNGTLTGAIPSSQFNQNVNVNIGRRTGGYYFNGVIDELRIYNRALSQAEIQSDMNAPIGSASASCDQNHDGTVNVQDVQLVINQALGLAACTTGDLDENGRCDVVDLQRVINTVLGAACRTGP
jgi:Protein of unknown function (DUF4038)/Concanavalin A-like lectin/glucanases superfamily/Putative collagen-binding domain of a collagenase/Fibronectin type III domain